MESLIQRIAQEPLSFLPEVSLVSLRSYLRGYFAHLSMCHVRPPESEHLFEFNDWIHKKYGASTSHGAAEILQSYSTSEEDAYRKFIEEFSNFSAISQTEKGNPEEKVVDENYIPLQSFEELLASMREKPALYLGFVTFRRAAAYLRGHLRAGQDLNFLPDSGEHEFRDFQDWIEKTKNHGMHRSWYQLVLFNSATDCAHDDRGAFRVFYQWFDEFAKTRSV